MLKVVSRPISLPSEVVQEDFNRKVFNHFSLKNIDYLTLSREKQHQALMLYSKIDTDIDVIRKGYSIPKYRANPQAVIIGRNKILKESQSKSISPSDALLIQLVDSLGFDIRHCYYTNLSNIVTYSMNDFTLDKFKRAFLYKDLELDTLEKIPQVFILLGNDATNVFFNTNATVLNNLGSIYLAEYKGAKRLFIPLPHPTYLLRDTTLKNNILKMCLSIKSSLNKVHN